MKLKKVKRVISGLVVTAMAMSCFVTSVAAEGGDIEKVRREFSLNYLNSLPKEGEKGFSEFLVSDPLKRNVVNTENIEDNLKTNRTDTVEHKDGTTEELKINEEEVYNGIKSKVEKIVCDVDNGNFEQEITDESQKNEYKKMSEKTKIAGAIYEWVTKNIEYDYESTQEDTNGEKSFRKPQDVFFVYSQKKGICLGKAQLVTLMMRLAGIASVCANTDTHAYNAVYLKQEDNVDRTGWVLLDSSKGDDVNLNQCFPAFYNAALSFKANNDDILKLDSHDDIWLFMGINSGQRYYFTIDGVSYAPVYGYDLEHSYLEVLNSDWEKKHNINVKNYTIPPFIASLGMSLQICAGIESIDLKEDKEANVLDISRACDLRSITKNGSDKYTFLAGIILDKETKEVVKTPKKWGPIVGQTEQGVYYDIYLNNEKTKIERIKLGGIGDPEVKDVKVPEYLAQLNVSIEIQSNIKSLILEGDENLNLLWASGLESIDIKNSKRYEVRNGGVVDKILNTKLRPPINGKVVNVLK